MPGDRLRHQVITAPAIGCLCGTLFAGCSGCRFCCLFPTRSCLERNCHLLAPCEDAPQPAFVKIPSAAQPGTHVRTSSPHCGAPPRLRLGRPRIITTAASSYRVQQPAATETSELPCQQLRLPWGLRHTGDCAPALGVPHRDQRNASLLLVWRRAPGHGHHAGTAHTEHCASQPLPGSSLCDDSSRTTLTVLALTSCSSLLGAGLQTAV